MVFVLTISKTIVPIKDFQLNRCMGSREVFVNPVDGRDPATFEIVRTIGIDFT